MTKPVLVFQPSENETHETISDVAELLHHVHV